MQPAGTGPSTGRKVMYLLVPFIIIVLLAEFSMRVVYYQRQASYPLALVHAVAKYVARPMGWTERWRGIIDLPDELLVELTDMRAAIGGVGNPTRAVEHDTVLVKEHDQLGWVLREGVSVSARVLRWKNRELRHKPPILYTKADQKFSEKLAEYVKDNTLLEVTYNVTEDGFRRTLPTVRSQRKVLVIGDSVAFGVLVNDENTIASRIQRHLGSNVQVINAGVGGYDGDRAVLVAERQSQDRNFDALVYVAFENDFLGGGSNLETVMAKLNGIKERFSGKVIIVSVTYMEYTIRHIDSAWSVERLAETENLVRRTRELANDYGFGYLDWNELVDGYVREAESIWSPFGLYVDHSHVSPAGAALIAQSVVNILSHNKLGSN